MFRGMVTMGSADGTSVKAIADGAKRMVDRVLAVDLGGTNLRAAVVDHAGVLKHRRAIPTDAEEGPEAVLQRMAHLIQGVAAEADLPADAVVGIASPGPLNPRTGVVYFTPNLPGWRDVPLGPRLHQATGRVVHVANDGNCAALGEVAFGAAKGATDVIYIALGTGVGAGIVANGILIDGIRGLGPELGHTLVALDGPRCTCGSVGCLEAFVSGWAIAREARLVAGTRDGGGLRDAASGGPFTAGVVARAAEAGDVPARLILGRAGRALGAAIGSFLNMFNPQLIVIGGGVATLGDHLLDPARDAMAAHSFTSMREDATIVMSALGDDTGLYGAGALALVAEGATDLGRIA